MTTILLPPATHPTTATTPSAGELPGGTPTPGQPRGGALAFFRNLSTARKLLALTAACLAPSVILGAAVLNSLEGLHVQTDKVAELERAHAALYHLDNRASELKSDAYRSLFEADLATLEQEVTEDLASMDGVLHELDALDLPPAMEEGIGDLRPVVEENQAFVADFVALAQRDRDAARAQEPRIGEENDTLDTPLDDLQATADEAAEAADGRAANLQRNLQVLVLVLLAIGVLLAAGLAVWISRLIAGPLRRTVTVLEAVAQGRLEQRLDVESRDEVGQMATALNAALANLSNAFGKMDHNAQALASASEELSATSGQMSGSASESASQADLVSAAAEQVSRNVQTVATGTEEMSASIREIAQNATAAAGVAAQAVGVAESTNATVIKLGESSTEVGNVIKVINSIAEQTNLLALNATIEAARAGEAGKGFAVVANEVKELAQETSKATEDISRRIEAIQSDTDAAVKAIAEIAEIIGRINDTQTTIASAVEEQTATTNEMSRNVAEAATGSTDIAQNITGVARSASHTQMAAGSTTQASEELARMATEMRELVGAFHY